MSLFFESIKLLDGQLYALDMHQKRVDRTLKAHFKLFKGIYLKEKLSSINLPQSGLFKVRIRYNSQITNIDIDPYSLKSHTKIKIIQKDNILYPFKTMERSILHFDIKETDDVIFVKNNHICDASYSNIALFDGLDWCTPDTYLLAGVKREFLLSQKKIIQKPILLDDLQKYSQIAFINAMRDFEKTYTFVKKDQLLILDPVI